MSHEFCRKQFILLHVEYKKKLQVALKEEKNFFPLISNSKLRFIINVVNIGLWVNSKLKFLLSYWLVPLNQLGKIVL